MEVAELLIIRLDDVLDENKTITTMLVIITVFAALRAHHNIDKYIVKHNTNEYNYVKNIMQEYGVSNLSKDSVIYEKTGTFPRLKDGGIISLIYGEFYRISYPNMMAKLALFELGIDPDIPFENIYNYDDTKDEPIDESDERHKKLPEDPNILLIDMTKMDIRETYDYSGLRYFHE